MDKREGKHKTEMRKVSNWKVSMNFLELETSYQNVKRQFFKHTPGST